MQIQRRQYKDTINTKTLIQIYKVEGGDLEIIRMEKHAGMDALVDYHDINNPIIGSLSFSFGKYMYYHFAPKSNMILKGVMESARLSHHHLFIPR